jgi:DNA-binding NarL/FixJ family response regulator
MDTEKTSIWLFSQEPIFRDGLRRLLNSIDGFEVVGESNITEKLSSAVEIVLPTVAVVDVDINPESGFHLHHRLKQVSSTTSVIVMTSNFSDNQLFNAIREQASAYLSKEVSAENLTEMVRWVAQGGHPISDNLSASPAVAQQILAEFQTLSKQREVEDLVSPLTTREVDIISLMAQGFANKQIAVKLGVSEQTIKNHITSILSKLDANARTDAVVKAIRKGLITVEKEEEL